MGEARVCPNCGATPTVSVVVAGSGVNADAAFSTGEEPKMMKDTQERAGWLSVFGFLIPLFGWITFLICRNTQPRMAWAAMKAAIVRLLVNVAVVVLFLLFWLVRLALLL